MNLIISNQGVFPQEIIVKIAEKMGIKTWKSFSSTSRNNSNIFNWPDSKVIDFLSNKIGKMGLQEATSSKLRGTKTFPLFSKCTIMAGQCSEFLQSIINPNFEKGQLHLKIAGHNDGIIAEGISDQKYIEEVSFSRGKTRIQSEQVNNILSTLQKVHTLHLGQTLWIRDFDLVKMNNGLYFPSFMNIQHVNIQTDIDSRSLVKLIHLFPNLKSISLPGFFPHSKIHIEGKDEVATVEKALSAHENLDGFSTRSLITQTKGLHTNHS